MSVTFRMELVRILCSYKDVHQWNIWLREIMPFLSGVKMGDNGNECSSKILVFETFSCKTFYFILFFCLVEFQDGIAGCKHFFLLNVKWHKLSDNKYPKP